MAATFDMINTEPPLSVTTAVACSLLYSALYVAPFYLSPTLRATPLNARDSPACIRARVRSVGLTCILCTLITIGVLLSTGAVSRLSNLAHELGLFPTSLSALLRVQLLVAVLFSCSLFERFLADGEWRHMSLSGLHAALWSDWRSFRNLVAAPASEELVFRALSLPLYARAGVGPAALVFATPLVFGLAHAHHLVDFLRAATPAGAAGPPLQVWLVGIARTLFQLAYTSAFGAFAAFVFLRTGSLWAVVVAHGFCNWMGVPRLWGRVGEGFDGDGEGEAGVGWTVVYYALIPVGMYGFYVLLWPLTESEHALLAF